MQTDARIDALHQLLTRPMDAAQLCAALAMSQSAFSRWSRTVPGLIALGAARSRLYAMARPIAGVVTPLTVTAVDANGQLQQIGNFHALADGWYALTSSDSNSYRLYQGLPPFIADLRPQGFLGRLEPRKYAELDLPADILRWNDDHVLQYLSRRSEHAAGNLILGEESLSRYWESRQRADQAVIQACAQAQHYPELAQAAMRGEPAGSSAGGEQPKFTCIVQPGDDPDLVSHVLVKFSPPTDTESGRRWADLLVCEHLALSTLRQHGLPAADSTVRHLGERVFLEVMRFDRQGRHGRLPMITLAALDGELGMLDQSWTAAARKLWEQQQLPEEDRKLVEIFDLYGSLIGNVDKHHGNIAVSWDDKPRYRLLPAYDMLPMLYRPNSHGEVIEREWSALSLRGMNMSHLAAGMALAQAFWTQVDNDERISAEFKAIAARHAAAILRLAQ
ncbi:MAG: type II toxin-antitoxin system HipA family toxin YjjJ [Duganella sp.]